MTPERWMQVKDLFCTALEVAEEKRGQYLAARCGSDQELLGEVSALLDQSSGHGQAEDSTDSEADEPLASRLRNGAGVESLLGPPPQGEPERRADPEDRSAAGKDSDYTLSLGGAGPAPGVTQPRLQAFGDYELLTEIAHGGMGVVYKARQVSLNRVVALKMILAGQLASETEIRRFQSEAMAAATLDHRHIVGIYEIGCHKDQHYFTMPFIEGRSLAYAETRGRWCASNEAAKLVAKVARAVQYAHDHGILHRDLKPANIIVDEQGEPHISDFGLARHIGADSSLTLEGAVLGTPSFMAPEQAAGKTARLGATADIYGLGAILYFLLTGRPPFTAASALDTLVQVLEGEVIVPRVINPNVACDLERICLRCLEKSPERRYPTAGSLAEDLERFVRDEPVQARPPGFRPLLLHWMRHQPALVSRLLGLTICVAIAQGTYQLYHPSISRGQHIGILCTLGTWGLLSGVYQWAGQRERWRTVVPFLWVMLDTVCLTVVLRLDEGDSVGALPGPLLGCFLVLVTLSGLWFRVMVVGFATLLAMLAYSILILDLFRRHALQQWNWHIVFLLFLAVVGCAVAYQVHRVRALSRFYDRPL